MHRSVVFVSVVGAIAFAVFIALASTQTIVVPYFTPTTIEFSGLEKEYPVNGSISYTVSVKGYGSNCAILKVVTIHDGADVAFYRKADDCRYIEISYGPYNYTQNFSVDGPAVIGQAGEYVVQAEFEDQINGQKVVDSRSFIVK